MSKEQLFQLLPLPDDGLQQVLDLSLRQQMNKSPCSSSTASQQPGLQFYVHVPEIPKVPQWRRALGYIPSQPRDRGYTEPHYFEGYRSKALLSARRHARGVFIMER
jgi:hypothetical protein